MDFERFRKIEEIYHAAAARSPAERAIFLDETCGVDSELRREIEEMLAQDESSDLFIDKHPEKLAAEVFGDRAGENGFINRSIGRYIVRRILGEGGMGTVYLAEDTKLGRMVALKILQSDLTQNKNHVHRFMHEARSASALNHPNILTVYEIDEFRSPDGDSIHYIATEFLDGPTLHELIYSSATTIDELLKYLSQAAAGLAKAHAAGIVHRDLKPENVMVTTDGFAKILDFGLAKLTDTENELHRMKEHRSRSGVILGTLGYMSPEQALGSNEVDARSDIFSFGCMLYEAIAKRKAFQAESTVDALYRIIHLEPKPLDKFVVGISPDLREIVEKCLRKNPDERFQTIGEVASAIEKVSAEDLTKTLQLVYNRNESAPISAGSSNQRRQVTVMFADFSSLSEFFEDLDPEESARIFQSYWGFLEKIVTEGGGQIGERLADTFAAFWGTDRIYETDPENAVRTALRLQEETLNYFNQNLSGEIELAEFDPNSFHHRGFLRFGVSTGHVLLGNSGQSDGFMTGGAAVGLAKRLMARSRAGDLFISHETYRHVRGVFDVDEVSEVESFRPTSRRADSKTYSVKSVRPRSFRIESRGVEGVETSLVGRETELARMFEAFDDARNGRKLRAVTIVGDAGIGKSRLVFEFQDKLDLGHDEHQSFKARALETMRGLQFSLIRAMFAFQFDISESDTKAGAREKLVSGIIGMTAESPNEFSADGRGEEKAHFIGHLAGFDFADSPHLKGIIADEKQIQVRALNYAAQFFAAVAQDTPLVIYLDDLHWADGKSLDFIGFIEQNCAENPILLIETARPTIFENRPNWTEKRRDGLRLDLHPLSKSECEGLVGSILLKVENVPERLLDLVVGNSAGNPFYVEELIKMLIEKGVIATDREVWTIDTERLGEVTVPPTLTGVLESRLDRLSFWEKRILQRASVIGREFWDVSLREFEPEVDVPVILESLRAKELIFRKDRSAFGDTGEFIFKHALLRDVTYETVLLEDRRKWHGETAEWLIRTSGERENEYLSVIAEHFSKAREFARSAEWYVRAGHHDLKGYASESAESHFRTAIGLFNENDDGESGADGIIDALGGLGKAVYNQGRLGESIVVYENLLKSATEQGNRSHQAEACLGITISLFESGKLPESLEFAARVVELTENSPPSSQDRNRLSRGLYRYGRTLLSLGEPFRAIEFAERALAVASELESDHATARANAYHLLSYSNMIIGRFAESEKYELAGIAISREAGDVRTHGNFLVSLGNLEMLRGNAGKALQYYNDGLKLVRESGNTTGEILIENNSAHALLWLGEFERAADQMKRLIAQVGDGFFVICETYRALADALVGLGQYEEALGCVAKSLTLAEESSNQEVVADAWRTCGIVLSCLGEMRTVNGIECDADGCFAKSIEIFKSIEMRANVAHVLHNMSVHERNRGNEARSRELLDQAAAISRELGVNTEAKSPYFRFR